MDDSFLDDARRAPILFRRLSTFSIVWFDPFEEILGAPSIRIDDSPLGMHEKCGVSKVGYLVPIAIPDKERTEGVQL